MLWSTELILFVFSLSNIGIKIIQSYSKNSVLKLTQNNQFVMATITVFWLVFLMFSLFVHLIQSIFYLQNYILFFFDLISKLT